MKSCVYLENAEVKAYLKSLCDGVGEEADLGTVFQKANSKFDLPYDALAEAMYVAKEGGVNEENAKTLLSVDDEKLLRNAYMDGEIDETYLERWISDSDLQAIKEAKAAKAK